MVVILCVSAHIIENRLNDIAYVVPSKRAKVDNKK